jgi:hypothetical protein
MTIYWNDKFLTIIRPTNESTINLYQ